MALLEICCYSMECALTAQQNGADRVESVSYTHLTLPTICSV